MYNSQTSNSQDVVQTKHTDSRVGDGSFADTTTRVSEVGPEISSVIPLSISVLLLQIQRIYLAHAACSSYHRVYCSLTSRLSALARGYKCRQEQEKRKGEEEEQTLDRCTIFLSGFLEEGFI